MKGFITLALCLLVSFGAQAAPKLKAQDVIALKTHSGKEIRNLDLHESSKVLKSLESGDNIEIRDEVIYPEEVSELIVSKLTKARNTEKRPNPKDYN